MAESLGGLIGPNWPHNRKQTLSLINRGGKLGNQIQQNRAEKALSQEGSHFTNAQVPRALGSQTGTIWNSLVYSQADQTDRHAREYRGERGQGLQRTT